MWTMNARVLAGVLFLCLSACATPPQTRLLLATSPENLPRHAELTGVPFIAQDAFQCGPASLAMALNTANFSVTPDTLKPELYLPEQHGSLQVEMLAAARRHGATAYQLAPDLTAVLREVADGTPVIVLQNLAFNWYPVWHYAVVVGYDLNEAEIILRSGPEQRQLLPMRTFEYTWARGEYWAMTVLPPGKIAVTAEPTNFIAAISALEKVSGADAVKNTYRAALIRWPDNLSAQIALGNNAYRLHDLNAAETAFRQAAQTHPDSVAALNNLAQVLADQARYAEALSVAQHAVDLGGTLVPLAQKTLADIENKLQKSR
ncbi:MAG: PA2778 family cysteine peptidase [Gallionella sp.]